MNDSWEVEMFCKKFKDLTEEELMFIRETSSAPGVVPHDNFNMADKYKVLSNFYLAKQIEASSKSNDTHSKAIRRLTIALVIVGVLQVLVAAYQYLH